MRTELYTLFDDEVGRMKLEFLRRRVFVHYLAKASALRVARRAITIWPEVMKICAQLGYRFTEALFPSDKGLEKLCKRVGFVLKVRENGLTYMRCRNA